VTGGAGGSISFNGIGANGSLASLTNAVSGSTTGSLYLSQSATGGTGGGSGQSGGTGGLGGNAISTLTINNSEASLLNGSSTARGGAGGTSGFGISGQGGAASAGINLIGTGNVNASATAVGGAAGCIQSGCGNSASTVRGAPGGNATATAAGTRKPSIGRARKATLRSRDSKATAAKTADPNRETAHTDISRSSNGGSAATTSAPVTTVDNVRAYNSKLVEFTHANVVANFDFVRKLLGVNSPIRLIELSAEHARRQFEMLSEQTKQLTALAQKITLASAGAASQIA
jgi:hypothetical protein